MATPYTDIYDFFLEKIEDYSYIDPEIYPTMEDLHAQLRKYLRSAIVRFTQSNVNLQDRDEENKQFNADLNDFEMEILSLLMVLAYIQPKITSVQNMEQRLTDREYTSFSQGKHLQEMIALKKELQSEVSQLTSAYTFADGLNDLD